MVRAKPKNPKRKQNGLRQFVGLEKGLQDVNRDIINVNKKEAHRMRILVEMIMERLLAAMRRNSETFRFLAPKKWIGGSVFDGLKITEPDEFDVHVVLKLPEKLKPVLMDGGAPPSHVRVKIHNVKEMTSFPDKVRRDLADLIDAAGFLLAEKLKNSFFKSVLDKTLSNDFPNGDLRLGKHIYKINRVQQHGPAFTLTLDIEQTPINIDLVPSICLPGYQWPQNGFRPNPFPNGNKRLQAIALVAKKSPIGGKIQRQWRLNLQVQEKLILHHKCWLKPTIRVLKRMRDFLEHDQISSYAIKTIFLWELAKDCETLDDKKLPDRWKGPFSYCVVLMLCVYLKYLREGKIPYFWNKENNLIESVSQELLDKYVKDITKVVLDIKENPTAETIKKYLCVQYDEDTSDDDEEED